MALNPFETAFAGAKPAAPARGIAPPPPTQAGPPPDPVVVGPLLNEVPGRTDRIEIRVPAGSYVLPADIVSALGEGNTLAGTQVLEAMFGDLGEGDDASSPEPPIEIIAAGGEYIVAPAQIAALAGGDVGAGHNMLDAFVKDVRRDLVKTLQKLPGPAK